MNPIKPLKQNFSDRGWSIAILLVIILGIGLRCVNVSQKLYWADEAFTSLRISGYTLKEVAQTAYSGQPMTVAEFQKYQSPSPDKNLSHTVSGLVTEEPQLTPLYFVLVRLWSQGFGSSLAAVRSLSVTLGLFALCAMYWLGLQLFQSRFVALLSTALVAISPFHVLYAQEARPYSLLTLLILLSSGVFLRTLRQPTRLNWLLYSLTVTVGLYSHLTFIFAALAHGVYLLGLRHWGIVKQVRNYGLAMILGMIPFLPWLVAIALNKAQAQAMTDWSTGKMTAWNLIAIWAANISRLFFDVGFSGSLTSAQALLWLMLPIGLLVMLSAYALYFIQRHAPPRIWLFVWSQVGVILLLLWLPDLVFNGRTSTGPRYSFTLLLGLQLAVAYLLAVNLTKIKVTPFWKLLTIALFCGSIFSGVFSSSAAVWWHKSPIYTRHIPQVAALINQTTAPLVISVAVSDGDLMRVESLGHYLKSDTQLKFVSVHHVDDIEKLSIADRNVFVYLSNVLAQPALAQFQQQLQQVGQSTLQPLANTDNTLFKLAKVLS